MNNYCAPFNMNIPVRCTYTFHYKHLYATNIMVLCTSLFYCKHLSTNIMVLRTFLIYSVQMGWDYLQGYIHLQTLWCYAPYWFVRYNWTSNICRDFWLLNAAELQNIYSKYV